MMWDFDILLRYKKATESWRKNDVENTSTEVSLAAHSEMVKKGYEQQPVVLFSKENMEAYKPVPVVNLPPVSFIGGHSNQVITGNMQVD